MPRQAKLKYSREQGALRGHAITAGFWFWKRRESTGHAIYSAVSGSGATVDIQRLIVGLEYADFAPGGLAA